MRKISFEINDDLAEWLLAMDEAKRSLIFKLMNSIQKSSDWQKVFEKTSDQAEKLGLTEKELMDFLQRK